MPKYRKIDDEKYFDVEAELGRPVRYLHDDPDCSRGKNPCLIVTRTPSGWVYSCHRCGASGFRGLKGLPPQKMKDWYRRMKEGEPVRFKENVELPHDFSTDLSQHPKAMTWLMSVGISDQQAAEYSVGYSKYFDRLIFPVYQEGKLTYWVGRTFKPITKENPKWLAARTYRGEEIWFKAPGPIGSKSVVLVEDIPSAIKVSSVTHAIALLGSYIPDSLVFKLKNAGFKVVIWLDRDKVKKSVSLFSRFRAAGVDCTMRNTVLDPKKYTTQQIKEILGI